MRKSKRLVSPLMKRRADYEHVSVIHPAWIISPLSAYTHMHNNFDYCIGAYGINYISIWTPYFVHPLVSYGFKGGGICQDILKRHFM
jgi:hypothetical protein